MRFGLPALLWLALLIVAWSRQRQQELPREKLLVWGFGLGLARELFMFSHVAMQLIDPSHQESGGSFAEPLEHALTLAALVVVAGAFLRYLLDDVSTSRRYLWIGLTTTIICSFSISWWWIQHTTVNPEAKFNQSLGGLFFHLVSSVLIAIAIFFMARKRGWLRNVVLLALVLFMLSGVLKIVNLVTNRVYTDIFCRVSNSFHIWAIPVLGYVYLREQAIEKRQAEEELESYRDHLEEMVQDRTTELAAQNAVADTISQSLELDTLLETALDRVLAILEMDAGCIFLLEPDGETMTLKMYQGGASEDEFDEYSRQQCLCKGISVQAVTGMKPVVLDVSGDHAGGCGTSFVGEEGIQILISTPLVSKGRAVGVLTLGTRQHHTFQSHEMELLTAIGQQIGVAVENARLYQETERWAEELALLHEVSVFLTSTFDSITIYDQIAEQSAKLLDCPATSIFQWDEERQEAVHVSGYGVDDLVIENLGTLLNESGILSEVIAHRWSIAVEDAQIDPRLSSVWREDFKIRAFLCLPVRSKGKPSGFLCMIDQYEPRRWRLGEIKLIESFVNRAAIALENATLHKQLEWAAALEERQLIAAEMHDGLAQTLSYMGHRIDHVAELMDAGHTQAVLDECHRIRNTIDQATQQVRQSIASLQQSPPPRKPFQEWLAEVVDEFTASGGPAVTLSTRLKEPLFLPPSQVEQVLRVVQEALLNASRYAQAEQVIVSMEKWGDQIKVMVEDNGQGFDPGLTPQDGRDHFGLNIMRARAARIGGQLEVDSAPGLGARVTLSWSTSSSDSEHDARSTYALQSSILKSRAAQQE